MARLTDALLGQRAFGRSIRAPGAVDLTYGGQFGWAPNLGELINNQAYVRRNVQCIVLETPRFFSVMPEPDKWVQTCKSLMELHSRTIEGLNAGLKVEFDEHPVGGAGEMQQEFTDVKRDRSEITTTFVEKYGMPIQTFLMHWIQYGMMDPDTKYSLSATLSGQKPDDLLADWYTMSCLFYEPDPTHTKILKSWVTTNMMPKGTGDIIGKKEHTAASEVLNLSVEWTGVSQFSLGTNDFAQSILDSINLKNANPYLRPSFIQSLSSDVANAQEGLKKNIEDLGASAVPGVGN